MNTAITISTESPKVFFRNSRLVTTSQAIADYFDKQHKHVLEKIRSLDCSPEFATANFSTVAIKVQAGFMEKDAEGYEVTKDGFMFLVMGFTGKKAARLKEAYIAKFNTMEVELRKQQSGEVTPAVDMLNIDLHLCIRDGNVAFVRSFHPEKMTTPEEVMAVLKMKGWLIMPREELVGKLMTL
ncbi:Rha family transcriptional regulator [Enterobacter sp. WCHEn045836]|uniref:Rha family transcriptional regulator n=1 Tax=Enterobacter sp. WCHEn045836 TaxID=2497434 RepID=UPI000F81C38C|nr:Rha family transcriptional regulator [Enterobacter sp. WCHEn045836]RTQ01279.1 Rha family transcriptional regulator [Enterobacter sp. WCHEn045836]